MSLLPAETAVFPQELLSGPEMPPGEWYVLHTRPRAEKSLARKLLSWGVSYYLPIYKRQQRYSGRLRTAHLPLFPGYLFLHGDNDARVRALETNLVANTLTVPNQSELHSDLFHVNQLLGADVAAIPEEYMQPGTPVEIVQGPLAGMQGVLIKRSKNLKFFIEVRMLQQGVSVEVESWMVRSLVLPTRKPGPGSGDT